ncbi:zinc finger BED domain-containing protein 4-like [Xyrichtys novacula]|uniref:Zinc finger BED domain-containing protein 4-like n=1 Tax=Xyrichtys novacula TaxID=13765 RepID=A0AAV1FSS3_XYRNO|nr:zinc finger BED domain-containing protein 4-like [Xyrichtys novacula]
MRLRRTSPKLFTPPSQTHQKPRSRTAARTHSYTYTERQVDKARTHSYTYTERQRQVDEARTHTHTVAAGTAAVPGGRKKRDDFWPSSDTVQVTIKHNVLYGDGETGDSCGATASSCCGFKLSGKNTTNLKRHLFVD